MHIRSILRAACLAALGTAAAACEEGTGISEPSELRGTWAAEAWNGDAHAYVANDSLYLSGAATGWQNGPYVVVGIASFDGPGTYPLGARAAEIRYLAGGDGIWASYAQSAGGTLVVTDFGGGHVTGHVEFTADALPGERPAGARAAFQGEFRARMQLPRLPSR